MSDLEGMIGNIMNDPEQMKKVMEMASGLFGGGGGAPKESASPVQETSNSAPDLSGLFGGDGAGITPEMGAAAMKMLKGMNGKGNDKTAFLNSMKPYLSEPRRGKLEKAVGLARVLGMGLTIFGKGGIGK